MERLIDKSLQADISDILSSNDRYCTDEIKWRSHNIKIKHTLSINEYLNVMQRIAQDCKVSGTENVVRIELIDFAIKTSIISAFSNVKLPENINDLYYIVYGTDLYDVICKNISKIQLESIISSVNMCIHGCI